MRPPAAAELLAVPDVPVMLLLVGVWVPVPVPVVPVLVRL